MKIIIQNHHINFNDYLFLILSYNPYVIAMWTRGCPRSVMVKSMDWGIVVSEFVLQSRYYVHFRVNTLGKGKNPLILPDHQTYVNNEKSGSAFKMPSRTKSPTRIKKCNTQGSTRLLWGTYKIESMDNYTDRIVANLNLEEY